MNFQEAVFQKVAEKDAPPAVAFNPQAIVKKVDESSNVEIQRGCLVRPGVTLTVFDSADKIVSSDDSVTEAISYAFMNLMKQEDKKK
jgi:hypothetical protein